MGDGIREQEECKCLNIATTGERRRGICFVFTFREMGVAVKLCLAYLSAELVVMSSNSIKWKSEVVVTRCIAQLSSDLVVMGSISDRLKSW